MTHRGLQALRDNAWFRDFPAAALEALARAGHARRYGHGEYLARRGEAVPGMAVILDGGVRSTSLSADGHEFTFSLLKPGALVWLVSALDGGGTINDATAHGDTEVWIIPREAVLGLFDGYPALYAQFVRMLCYRMRKVHSVIEELTLVPVPQRLARQICTLAEAERRGRPIEGETTVDVTQQDLAVLLGVTRPIVNRALKKLEADGLVAARYHKVVVRDFPALHSRCANKELFSL